MGSGWERLRLVNFKTLKVKVSYSMPLSLQNYPSIRLLKNVSNGLTFNFSVVSAVNVEKETEDLNTHKATQSINIDKNILKQSADIFANYVCGISDE